MHIFNLFEKSATSTSDVEKSDIYQNTKDQRVRNMLRTAHRENPGAHSDLEALAGHMADVDATNKRQDAEEKQLRKTQDQMIKDLQNKEQRFRAFTAKVAAMDLSPQQSAKAAQDIEKDIEPDLEKYQDQDKEIKAKNAEQPKAKEKKAEPAFNPTTGTPKGDYKSKKDKPELRVVKHQAKNKEQPAPSVADVPVAPVQNIAAPVPTATPAVDTAAPQSPKHQQLSNLGMRFGNAANIPQFRRAAESIEETAVSSAEIEQIYNHNSQAFAKSYAESQAIKLYYGNGQWEDLTAAEVEQIVSAIATDYTEQARSQVWEQLFTNHNYFNDFKKQHLSQMPLFTTEELIGGNFGPAANDTGYTDIKTRAHAIIKAAYDPSVPDGVITQQKEMFRQDYPGWSFGITPDKKIATIVNHKTNVRIPIARLTDLSEDSWHAGDNAWSSDKNLWTEGTNETRLAVGDPVVVTGPNEFEGKTGEIAEFSPSGKFVIVNLYNHGEHSMHLSDVEYNQYADEEDEIDETIRKLGSQYRLYSGKGKNLGTFPTKAGAEKHEREVQYFKHADESVAEDAGPSPVTSAITRRILSQHLELLKQYGPELVGAAVDNVADYVGDVEEIGSSDVSAWVAQVERMLKDNPPEAFAESAVNPQFINAQVTKILAGEARRMTNAPMAQLLAPVMQEYGLTLPQIDSMIPGGLRKAAGEYGIMMKEGFQDFNKVEPYAVCLAGKPVKQFDYYEEARRFHDNWKKKLYREGDKAKADKITLMPLNLNEFAPGPERDGDEVPDQILTLANRWWNATDDQPKITNVLRSLGWSIAQVESEDDAVQMQHDDGTTYFISADDFDPEVFEENQGRVDPILIKALNRMPDGLATHREVLDAAYDAYTMEVGKIHIKQNYGVTNAYIPQLLGLYKEKHGLTFNEEYTPAPAKPFRNPPGFNKQGTGVGNKLAQQTRAELAKKKQPGVTETELNPRDPAGDLAAKRKALQDLSMNKDVDQAAVQQRKLDLDREANTKGVAEGHADQQRKVFKKNGEPVGEVGIDRESSPGVGQWYMKHYASGKDLAGYDSYEEALAELKHCMKQGVAEDTGSWIVYDPKTKQIKKRFKTHTAGKSYAKTHGLGFASSEYYFDNVKEKEVAEGWYNPQSFPGAKVGANLTGQQPRTPVPQVKDQIIKSLMATHKDVISQFGQRDVNIVAQSEAAKAEPTPQGIRKAVDNVINFLTSGLSVNRLRQQTLEGEEHTPVASAITRRILMQRHDLLKQYGPELVTAAIDNVADYVGDVDEIGSSDVSSWIAQVERMLKDNPPEAFSEGVIYDLEKEYGYEKPKSQLRRSAPNDYPYSKEEDDDYFREIFRKKREAAAKAQGGSLNELSTEKLAQYKKAAGADAGAADKRGDIERGNKRFKGIVKATIKQSNNDLKKHKDQGVAEGQTDYQKRRQRERDVDAGRPVKSLPKNPQTDYARKRAEQKRQEQLGENYWTKLQNERSVKLNSLVNELKESVK